MAFNRKFRPSSQIICNKWDFIWIHQRLDDSFIHELTRLKVYEQINEVIVYSLFILCY